MNQDLVLYIGYSASFFIVLSFILRDIKKIRIVNFIGCLCFVLYGFYSGPLWPVIIPNALLCFIQIYQLFSLYKEKAKESE